MKAIYVSAELGRTLLEGYRNGWSIRALARRNGNRYSPATIRRSLLAAGAVLRPSGGVGLGIDERIVTLRRGGRKLREIAACLNVSRSCVGRRLKACGM